MYDFKNINWKKNNTSVVKFLYIDNNNYKIYKKYKSNSCVIKLKNIYNKIKKFDFVPIMVFFENENIIIEEYFKNNLTILNKPNNYIYQLLRIKKKLKENNIYHNDLKLEHFFVKNGKIKLIDWNCITFDKPKKKKWSNNKISIFILYYSLDKIILLILSFVLLYYLCNKNRKILNNLIIK
jgi:serine/threonine protein kinase